MSRPIIGDIRTQIYNRLQKNGTYYVYERTVKYNPEKGYNETLSNKLIGKRLTKDGEILDTNFRTTPKTTSNIRNGVTTAEHNLKTDSSVKDPQTDLTGTSRWHFGLMSLLRWIGKASGIDEDLHKIMPAVQCGPIASRIISIARFWLGTGGNTIPCMFNWQVKHGIVGDDMLTEEMCGRIFETLGQHEEYIQGYFKARARRLLPENTIAFDSSSISTYSKNQSQARYGYNKDQDGLPVIKLLTLYSTKDDQPFAFCNQPGNIPDVISVSNALKQLGFLDLKKKPIIVKDNGFYSAANLVMCVNMHMKFLIRVTPKDASWIREAIDEHLAQLEEARNVLPWEINTSAIAVTLRPTLSTTWQYTTQNHKKGELVTINPRFYLIITLNKEKRNSERNNLLSEIFDLKARLEKGEELTDAAMKRAEKFLECKKTKAGLKVTINQDQIDKASRYYGITGILSNDIKDRETAIRLYRGREHIEDMFELLKQKADGGKPRVWDSDRLRGRQFVQFVALGYYDFLYTRLRNLKKSLGVKNGDEEHDSAENLKKERALLKWLNNVSLYDILQWFDAVEITRLVGNKHPATTIVTERTERDRMFLDRLGYTGEMLKQ